MKTGNSTVDHAEVEQFSRIADQWWDPRGKFKPLHDINPLRVDWILRQVNGKSWIVDGEENNHQPLSTNHQTPLKGLRLLDIGCGGGLICEPMARLGAAVTGIDASEKNIAVASLHAKNSGLAIDYRCTTAEELAATNKSYDVVLALEIVEHVADVALFTQSCATLVKPGGMLIMSTINRTLKSYVFAIVGAEYVLRILPRGTHDWNKFLTPAELCRGLQKNGIEITEMTGMTLNPLNWKWQLNAKDVEVNYLVAGSKPAK